MLYIKRIIITAFCLCLSLSVYAAVTPLSDMEYTYSPVSILGSDSCSYAPYPESYNGISVACSLHNAKNGRSCVEKKYCKGTNVVTVNECPDAYAYSMDDVSDIVGLSSQEYCTGYKNGVKSNYFYNNPRQCSLYGITSDKYLKSGLNSLGKCGSYNNVEAKSCFYENEDGENESLNVCILSSNAGYPLCSSADTSFSPYDFKTCGASSNEEAIPCYIKCGASKYCLGFTCNREILLTCSQLEEDQKALGFHSSGISNVKTDDFTYQCRDGSAIKYMGFFCQDYMLKDDCENAGGTLGSTCQVRQVGGGSKTVYQCSCGTAKTLSEYCATEHAGEADCTSKYYGVGQACTLNTQSSSSPMKARAAAAAAVRYYAYASDEGLCDNIEGYLWDVKGTGDCPQIGTDPVRTGQCRIETETADESDTQDICIYCADYVSSEDAAKAACATVNGTPHICQNKSGTKVYVGCDCDRSKYKTIEEWCATDEYKDITNCAQMISGSEECHTRVEGAGGDLGEDKIYYGGLKCQSQYKSKEEWCEANKSQIISGYSCNDYVGEGEACKFEGSTPESWKYVNYVLKCPSGSGTEVYVKEKEQYCMLEGETQSYATKCFKFNDETKKYEVGGYICSCPPSYGTECSNTNKVRGGNMCNFDRDASGRVAYKYASCELSCTNKFVGLSAEFIYQCPEFDNHVATIRGGADNPKMCVAVNGTERNFRYICGCPAEFKTLNNWCENEFQDDTAAVEDCKQNYTGSGSPCLLDVDEDEDGNPVRSLTKYASYVRYCPTDRPLYYSEEDCRYIGGEYEYSCIDANSEKVVCQCPLGWFTSDDNSCSDVVIELNGDDEITIMREASGDTCDFDGTDKIKYKECTIKCTDILSNDKIVKENAYKYLYSDNGAPSQAMCTAEMGNGAVLGFSSIAEISKSYCSANHTVMYPCYCPASFKECLAENNEVAADNAKICSINGKTYYSECQMMACPTETSTLAVVDKDTDVAAIFGPGALSAPCSVGGVEKLQVTCDSSIYVDPCDYPYEAPKNGSWCKYGEGETLMKNGRAHYQKGACRVQKTLGECGKNIAGDDSEYIIFVETTESECKSKYGPGIKTQLCEYGAENGYKRAYNCYYDPTAFKYTTANCGVRHDLTGNYIIVSGKKYWDQCNCASAYKHHKFNCGGLLSGNPCQQELNQSLINNDASLQEAVDENAINVGATLPFYPYCQCSADYTEVCDDDGSGRYKGVGTACNGKYTACECVPDPLPDNWTDNYYGCPGGKKPTGVWKDNGCGKKYYQCSVVECTWEYTEKCEAPLIPVGQSCQDNEGNIGGYKACTCPDGYTTCPTGQVGVGEPCNLKGVPHYKSCKTQEACTSLATETCTGALQIGINPCLRDGITYYESCACANGYSEACGEGEVGVGNFCELNGKKYYKECKKPEQCPESGDYVSACDTNQESYSPCTKWVDGKQVVNYLCRCPSNWKTEDQCRKEGGSADIGGEICTVGGTTYYSKCSTDNECSSYQDLTYSVCSSAQSGEGPSCVSREYDEEGNEKSQVIKYASCKDSDNCLTNGFRYTCSGYDQSALDESCVDSNGNRLYKSCPCPSSYVSCSNPNASKGTKCVPLEADGSFGPAKYSTCACDRSKYKYTCLPEGGNKGVIAPNTTDFCTVDEEYTTTTVDEDGNVLTSVGTKQIKYYKTCECNSSYRYTCSDFLKGSVVPSYYEDDYCQINISKFYKGCDCETSYKETVTTCAAMPGQTVDASLGICQVQGRVYESVSSDEYGEQITSGLKDTGNRYKACKCKSNYILDCNGEYPDMEGGKYNFTNIDSCIKDGKAYYPQCKCNASYTKQCQPSGRNQGIEEDKNSVCVEKIAYPDGSGWQETPKNLACTCKSEYSLSASTCDYPYYDQSRENYCDADKEDNEDNFKYKQCSCNSLYYETTAYTGVSGMNDSAAAQAYCESLGNGSRYDPRSEDVDVEYPLFCPQRNSASIEATYFPKRGICCRDSANLTGYELLKIGEFYNTVALFENYSKEEISAEIETKCKYKYNATFQFDCAGNVYYKCINETIAKSSNTWYTNAECKALDRNETPLLLVSGDSQLIKDSWAGADYTVYSSCGCPSNYNKTKSCTENKVNNLRTALIGNGAEGPLCFNVGHRYKDGDDHGYALTPSSVDECHLLTNNESCIDINGSSKYDWKKCACDASKYPVSKSTSTATIDSIKFNNTSGTYHYKYCFDLQNHVFRNTGSGKGESGGIVRGSTLEYYRYCHQSGDVIKCKGSRW